MGIMNWSKKGYVKVDVLETGGWSIIAYGNTITLEELDLMSEALEGMLITGEWEWD